jgi:hypothetical protein
MGEVYSALDTGERLSAALKSQAAGGKFCVRIGENRSAGPKSHWARKRLCEGNNSSLVA